jgi:integrase
VQIKIGGERRSQVFDTKAEASQWALAETAAGKRGPVGNRIMLDGLRKLHDELVNDGKSRSDIGRALRLQDDPLAQVRLADVDATALGAFRDRRLALVSDATVRRELNLLRGMFRRMREDWRWMTRNPFVGVKAPKSPASRKRRITQAEVDRVRVALGVDGGLPSATLTQRVGLAFLFALETAMRASEILGMRWPDVRMDQRFVHLPRSKNGDARDVPLSSTAVAILQALPRLPDDDRCFLLAEGQRDALWRKARDKAAVDDLHFHDSRAEGIWRLSKKLDVLQLARAIGHRDINSLLIYYDETAEEMAAKLD